MSKRTDTINLVLAAGKPAGTYRLTGVLDTLYKRATGVVAYINSKPVSLDTFQLGIRNDAEVFVAPTNIDHLRAGVDCPKPARLTSLNIPCDNRNLNITVVLPTALPEGEGDLNVDLVFELEKED